MIMLKAFFLAVAAVLINSQSILLEQSSSKNISQLLNPTIPKIPIYISDYYGGETLKDLPNFEPLISKIIKTQRSLRNFTSFAIHSVPKIEACKQFTYLIIFQNPDGCTAEINVCEDFVVKSSSIKMLSCEKNLTKPVNSASNRGVPAGTYRVQPRPSGDRCSIASAETGRDIGSSGSTSFVLAETQTVAGTNYRFTLRNQNGSLIQEVVYVPIGQMLRSQAQKPVIQVHDKQVLQKAHKQFTAKYPELKSYCYNTDLYQISPVDAHQKGYAVVSFQKSSAKSIEYVRFYAAYEFVGNNLTFSKFTQETRISLKGFPVDQLITNYNKNMVPKQVNAQKLARL